MNNDFSKYQKIIKQFSGQVLNSDFEARYNAVAKNIPKSERFLLKMELKRLAAPCSRLIDLRGHVDGECKPFEHEDKTHFLDTTAKNVFLETFRHYGSYTFGVYEATMNTENNFRVIYQKEKKRINVNPQLDNSKSLEKSQYPAKFYSFGPYFDRCEERMNFAISIQVTLDNNYSFECSSSDISVKGCKFRVNGVQPIKLGQQISLRFTGLEEEFQFGGKSDFDYQIKNIQTVDNIQLVGAERLIEQSNRPDSFSKFLDGFIQGNKRRYKINLDNTIQALQSRNFEQYVLPKSNELPIFIENNDELLTPKYALTCNNNQKLFQYWQDEKRYSTLYCLLTPERIARLKKATVSGKPLLVFSFIHTSLGKSYFYTADEMQLAEDKDFLPYYLGFAASKDSFKVVQLTLDDVFPRRAESPLTLSNTLTRQNEFLNLPVPDEVKSLLSKTPYFIIAEDVTYSEAAQAYKALSFEGIDTAKLKAFGHKRMSEPFSVDEVGINYRNHRQELRFKYKTPAQVEIANIKWQGTSLDFSKSGLKVELEKSTALVKGDIVSVTFPALQKITSAFDLAGLPYEVMRINSAKTILNLRVFVKQHQHIGRKFFRALIEKNRDKLTTDEYAMSSPGLAKALRNVYSRSLNIPTVVIQTSGSRYKTEVIASGVSNGNLMSAMMKLSDNKSYYNLFPIFGHPELMVNLTAKLKKMVPTDESSDELLYIAINADENNLEKKATTKLASEFGSEKLKQMFIQQALKKGQFFSVLLKLSRAAEPDMDYLNPELSYIGSYAIHRGKQIEQDIWSVAGVAQLFDVTQEVLFRYQLTEKISQPT